MRTIKPYSKRAPFIMRKPGPSSEFDLYCSHNRRLSGEISMSTWRFYAIHFVVAVLGVALATAMSAQSPSTEHIPHGWYVYAHSNLKHADENTLRCFNFSHNEWRVSLEGDKVDITKWSGRKPDNPSLPPRLKLEPGMPGRTV